MSGARSKKAAAGTTRRRPDPEYVTAGFTVLVDSREQAPFTFTGFRGIITRQRNKQTEKLNLPLLIPTRVVGLTTGDYSIEGQQYRIAVERKSLVDFFGCCGTDRERFEDQLRRLNDLEIAEVVIEGDWPAILGSPPPHSRMSPKAVYRSVIAWKQRFRGVHWNLCPTRWFAERTTFRILERFCRDIDEDKRAPF